VGLDRSGSSRGGKVKERGWLAQSLSSVGRSVRLFWAAVKQPHMLRPVVFLFLLQVRQRKVFAHAFPAP
jgi:hypothetical protein